MQPTPPSLARFFVRTLAWLCLLVPAWYAASPWMSHPAAALTHMALEFGAPDWVRTVRKEPGRIEVETSVAVDVPNAPKGSRGELVAEAKPAHYGYGLPIFLALLLAARGRMRLARAPVGYVLLLPAQAFSLTADVLKQIAVSAAGGASALGVAQWQLELIGYCYQFGTLVLPTLAPVVLWLWMDRDFFATAIAARWDADRDAVSR
jgi:hypothetical protein